MRAWAWWLGLVAALARARELDPAACATRFDVQRDKIIRTEESREMGARYLSELDVGARHECLRLCCETDACDVFVYEEKSPGSCYLFNCGPPEDFRCKFTAHSNFSSGVLALSRRLAELQDQERLAHHEQELANLRSVTSTTPRTTTTPTTTAPTPPPRIPQPPELPQPPPRRCSRYQFECHSGGECIAVYNACDGVPQCADGSDEAPELGCPPAPPAPPAPAAPPPANTPAPATALRTTPAKPVQESAEMALGNEALAVENTVLGGERWPHRLTQAQPQHRYDEPGPSSHIFSHKGGLLQEPDAGMGGLGAQYPAFEPPWPRRPWAQQQTNVDSMSGERWGGVGGVGGVGGGYPRLDWREPDPRRAWPVPQPRPEPEMPVYMPPKTMPEMPMMYSSQQQTLRDSPKKGFDLMNKKLAEVVTEPASPPRPAPGSRDRSGEAVPSHIENTTKKKVVKIDSVAASKPAAAVGGDKSAVSSLSAAAAAAVAAAHEHYAADEEHDGLSEHPPAAVLLLVLGILMTTVMGVMLGCRARAARRRLRRGKSPFAHDADYLVNGMYL